SDGPLIASFTRRVVTVSMPMVSLKRVQESRTVATTITSALSTRARSSGTTYVAAKTGKAPAKIADTADMTLANFGTNSSELCGTADFSACSAERRDAAHDEALP